MWALQVGCSWNACSVDGTDSCRIWHPMGLPVFRHPHPTQRCFTGGREGGAVWELEEGDEDTPPFSSDQQEEGPRGSTACRAMLPSNSGDFTANSPNPRFLSSNLGKAEARPDILSAPQFPPSLSPLDAGVNAQGKLANQGLQVCQSFRQGPEFLGHPAIWWRWGTRDVPETDWGTDLLLQGWVGPKHAWRDTPTPQLWNPSQPPSPLGAPSWLILIPT